MRDKTMPGVYCPKYSLFYDFHTSPDYPAVGKYFDAGGFTDRIKKCGVDFLTFHARCNMGMAYYDTALGIRHPSLTYDLFGNLATACAQKGIRLNAYFNGGISHAECVAHPDWCVVPFDDGKATGLRDSVLSRLTCCNSPYHEHMVTMVREVAEKYHVAGFFIDCMFTSACLCRYCIDKMNEQGIDWHDREQVLAFNHQSLIKFAEDISQTARAVNPEYLIYFNCLDYGEQKDIGTYLECECIPSRPDWGYEYLPVMSHYMRTLDRQPLLNMTARFYSWGDFGGMRPENAVKSELLYGIANGMRPNIGDHFHPNGTMNMAVLDRVDQVYSYLRQFDSWLDEALPLTEAALVYPRKLENIRFDDEVRGATRLLSELFIQFDLVTAETDWSKYDLLIIPDSVLFDNEISARIKCRLKAGGKIISSGWSGLNDQSEFLPEWGISYVRDCPFSPVYYKPVDVFSENIPDMPLAVYANGIQIKPKPETAVGAYLLKSFKNCGWDGHYPQYYTPPENTPEGPFLTINGQVAHFSHKIFQGYKRFAPVQFRILLKNLLAQLYPRPMVKIINAPSFLRAFVNTKKNLSLIHLLAHIPEQRGLEAAIVEDDLIVNNLIISLRIESKTPTEVYLAPQRQALKYTIDNGYISILLPAMQGYALIGIEF